MSSSQPADWFDPECSDIIEIPPSRLAAMLTRIDHVLALSALEMDREPALARALAATCRVTLAASC